MKRLHIGYALKFALFSLPPHVSYGRYLSPDRPLLRLQTALQALDVEVLAR